MVKINKIEIDPLEGTLFIDVKVDEAVYYNDIYLKGIYIDTQSTYNENGPSDQLVYSEEQANVDISQGQQGIKEWTLTIPESAILATLSDNMFFIWIKTQGDFASDTPCGGDNYLTLAIVLDPHIIYKKMLDLIQSNRNCCSPNTVLIDYYLVFQSLQYALINKDNSFAIKQYNMLVKNNYNNILNSICNGGCS